MSTVILRTTARLVTPGIVGASLYLLLRGHNAPGGGFIGALVAGAAIVLRYLVGGPVAVRRMLPVSAESLLGVGLLIALMTGIGSLIAGSEFLTSTIWSARIPGIGKVKVASSLAFDIGVYLIVLGVIVGVVGFLGEDDQVMQ
ncbi:MAG TPA: MnhB domain-containing protein [Actinomycetota bacterium]|nr:MnhB domain-containing protein [Actinomycetota bacterium]